jgi:DNA invertase Pin-like site-specific DNA recombinase
MSIIGYARVSTSDQSLTIQQEQLEAAGAERVFCEQRSGREARSREALQDCLGYLREGDILVVTRLDRLGRSMIDLLEILQKVQAKGAAFRCLHQSLDTTTAEGRLMFGLLGAFAEFELTLRAERQKEGIAKAKGRGAYKGKKPTVNADQILEMKARGLGPADIARELKVTKPTVYRNSPPGTWGPRPEKLARYWERVEAHP